MSDLVAEPNQTVLVQLLLSLVHLVLSLVQPVLFLVPTIPLPRPTLPPPNIFFICMLLFICMLYVLFCIVLNKTNPESVFLLCMAMYGKTGNYSLRLESAISKLLVIKIIHSSC